MSNVRSSQHITLPPHPSAESPGHGTGSSQNGRAVSFSAIRPRRASASRWRSLVDDEAGFEHADIPPPIPSAVQAPGESIPLPTLSMIVLSIVSRLYSRIPHPESE